MFLQWRSVLYILEYFKPFFPEYSCFFIDVFSEFIMEQSPIASIVFEVIQLSEWVNIRSAIFAYISCLQTTWQGGSGTSDQVHLIGNAILGIDGNLNCIK